MTQWQGCGSGTGRMCKIERRAKWEVKCLRLERVVGAIGGWKTMMHWHWQSSSSSNRSAFEGSLAANGGRLAAEDTRGVGHRSPTATSLSPLAVEVAVAMGFACRHLGMVIQHKLPLRDNGERKTLRIRPLFHWLRVHQLMAMTLERQGKAKGKL